MELAAGISATTHVIGLVKSIRDADKALDAATLKAKLADIINELADLKITQLETLDIVRQLEDEKKRLLQSSYDIASLTEEKGYFYRKEGNGLIGWPACPTYISREKRVSFLVQNGGFLDAKCPHCVSDFSPVTSYLSPGYSRADEASAQRKRASERHNNLLRSLNGY